MYIFLPPGKILELSEAYAPIIRDYVRVHWGNAAAGFTDADREGHTATVQDLLLEHAVASVAIRRTGVAKAEVAKASKAAWQTAKLRINRKGGRPESMFWVAWGRVDQSIQIAGNPLRDRLRGISIASRMRRAWSAIPLVRDERMQIVRDERMQIALDTPARASGAGTSR